MPFLLLVLKEWKVSLIVLLSSLLLISLIFTGSLNRSKDKIEYEFKEYKAYIEKQNLINSNKQKQQELEAANNQVEIERKYNEKITKLQNDITAVNSSNRSLSEQLTSNTEKLSRVTKDQADAYTKSLTELSVNCTTRYTEMGEIAQKHRLAEERAVGMYNALVDVGKEGSKEGSEVGSVESEVK